MIRLLVRLRTCFSQRWARQWRYKLRRPSRGCSWPTGPIQQANSHFLVLRVAPQASGGLWLLPITSAERDFKVANGQEALEGRFEQRQLEYWDINRLSLA